MSKLITTHIERDGGDLNLTPRGTGSIEVVNKNINDDATVQINHASGNNVRIKAPSNDSDYELRLPDVDPVLNQFFKITSATISNNEAVLGYGVPGDLDDTDASNYKTGTIPQDRLIFFDGSKGASLKLVTSLELTGADTITAISFSFDQNKHYKLIGQNLHFSESDHANMQFLDSNDNPQTIAYNYFFGAADEYVTEANDSFMPLDSNQDALTFIFEADISTKTGLSSVISRGFSRTFSSRFEGYATFREDSSHDADIINKIKFYPSKTNVSFIAGTKLYLYEYREA